MQDTPNSEVRMILKKIRTNNVSLKTLRSAKTKIKVFVFRKKNQIKTIDQNIERNFVLEVSSRVYEI